MTNYHHHPIANPLDGIIIALMPSGAPSTEPEPPQFIPQEQPGMHQFLWIWDHRAGMDAEHLVEKYGVRVSGRVVPQKSGDFWLTLIAIAGWLLLIILVLGWPQ